MTMVQTKHAVFFFHLQMIVLIFVFTMWTCFPEDKMKSTSTFLKFFYNSWALCGSKLSFSLFLFHFLCECSVLLKALQKQKNKKSYQSNSFPCQNSVVTSVEKGCWEHQSTEPGESYSYGHLVTLYMSGSWQPISFRRSPSSR